MAIATSTAIAMGISAAGSAMSFAQANKQQRLMKDAQAKADQAMQDARKKLEVNVFASQALNKEPYRLQREALLSAGAQAIEAGVESERGAAATAGRAMMAQNEAQAQQAAEMNKDLMALEQQQLAEQSRLNDIGIQLDLGEVEGAQAAAANYENMANQAQAQGVQGLMDAGKTFVSGLKSLEDKTAAVKAFQDLKESGQKYNLKGTDLQGTVSNLGVVNGFDTSKLANMGQLEFASTMSSLQPETLKQINDKFKNYSNATMGAAAVGPIMGGFFNPFNYTK